VIVTNCSNNYGPYQHPEKFIPTVIRTALEEDAIPIFGTGRNVRDWLHVEDHVAGLLRAAFNGQSGSTYLFGGRAELTNLALCQMLCGLLDEYQPRACGRSYAELITFVSDRPGHDSRYAIDCSRAEGELGWHRTVDVRRGLAATVKWFLSNPDWFNRPTKDLERLGLSPSTLNELELA
jgi:dTDP-glucose 4,6-dehydratase